MNQRSIRRITVTAVACAASALAVTAAAPAATAAPSVAANTLTVAYDAAGTSYIAKPATSVKLGPTTLTSTLDLDTGALTGSLPIPPTTTTFKVAGLIPTSATVSFVPVGVVTGSLNPDPVPNVTATSTYYLKLSNVKLAGLPGFVGNSCQTSSPVAITVKTPAGQRFNVLTGGTVAGTYTIGKFANCGLTTGLINLLVPGPNNTVSFTLSNGRLAG